MDCSTHSVPFQSPGQLHARNILLGAVTVILAVISAPRSCSAESPRMVEVRDETQEYVGKVIRSDSQVCCLIDRTGYLHRLSVSSLQSFRALGQPFTPLSAGQVSDALRKELGSRYSVGATTHYVVAAPGDKVQSYQVLFEDIYRSVEQFYRVRGFRTTRPDGLLVAIVFGSQKEFADYCRRDEVPWSEGLRGYYSLRSNRVVLYDDPTMFQSAVTDPASGLPIRSTMARIQPDERITVPSMISGMAADTVIHESTHQVGFNIGIHSRLGGTPQWVLEGLATVLEAPGMRRQTGNPTLADKINAERLDWFRTQYLPRRRLGDLASLVASDDMFDRATLDAYSHAWAVTFFLTDNPARSRKFMAYLQKLEQQTVDGPISPEERLSLFRESFGDVARLEVEFHRWMDRLED